MVGLGEETVQKARTLTLNPLVEVDTEVHKKESSRLTPSCQLR